MVNQNYKPITLTCRALFRVKDFPENVAVTFLETADYDTHLPAELNQVQFNLHSTLV